MSAIDPWEKRLAEVAAILVEAIHHDVPTASTRPLAPYDDEDFTLEVLIPAGMDRDTMMDLCIRHALAIEDRFGFLTLRPSSVTIACPLSRAHTAEPCRAVLLSQHMTPTP
jgi:hypothetical protein